MDTWSNTFEHSSVFFPPVRANRVLSMMNTSLRSFPVSRRIVRLMICSNSSSTNRSQFIFAALRKRYSVFLKNASVMRPRDKLHILAPVAKHQTQQMLENPECKNSFLFLAPARSEQACYAVIVVEFFQRCADFPLFIFFVLCYDCHGKNLL